MFKYKYALIVVLSGLLSACPTMGLEKIRHDRLSDDAKATREKIATQRSFYIEPDDTSFSKAIACLSEPILNWRMMEFTQQVLDQVAEMKVKIENLNKRLGTQLSKENSGLQQSVNAIKLQLKPAQEEKLFALELEKRILDNKIEKNILSPAEKSRYLSVQKEIKATSNNIENMNYILNIAENSRDAESSVNNARDSDVLKISVAPIYDKTEKVFPKDSTALSELVTHALSYNHAVSVVDTPFNSDSAHISRVSIDNKMLGNSIGSAIPADMFIDGAIVQYDEGDARPALSQAALNLRAVQINRNVNTITVGLTLRLVQTNNGVIHHNKYVHKKNDVHKKDLDDHDYTVEPEIGGKTHTPKPQSIYLQNTFFVKRIQGGITRIIGSKYWGINGSVDVEDPKMYAVREMVEKGIYELLDGALPTYSKNKESYEEVEKEIITGRKCRDLLPRLKMN